MWTREEGGVFRIEEEEEGVMSGIGGVMSAIEGAAFLGARNERRISFAAACMG